MYNSHRTSKVTFVENLPEMDELVENYEQPSTPQQPPPKKNGFYTSYENIYGGNIDKRSMGNFQEESTNKDLLLNKAMQKLPSRMNSGDLQLPQQPSPPPPSFQPPPPPMYAHNVHETDMQSKIYVPEHHHNKPYVIYENNQLPSYSNYMTPPPSYAPPPKRRLKPKRPKSAKAQARRPDGVQVHSLCSMINSHISSCSLCNNLYISTIKSKSKPPHRSMSTVAFVIVIIILIIVCFILMKKIWKQDAPISG
jgi:hypothetical protein